MSTESTPATGYTLRIGLNDVRTYDCDLCCEHSPDIDSARAHRAIHVAGPDLLKAAKDLVAANFMNDTAERKLIAAIDKAEP